MKVLSCPWIKNQIRKRSRPLRPSMASQSFFRAKGKAASMLQYGQDQTCDYTSDEVYPPAEDTYLLLKAALDESRPADRAIEIGCGSGILTQELSSRVQRLIATDINPHALRATRSRGGKVALIRADIFKGIGGRFDLVLFNPPYLPFRPEERSGSWIDRALDGGESGRETIDRFLQGLEDHLLPGGRALLLVSSLTGLHEVIETASSLGLQAKVILCQRCFFEQLYVLRIWAKGNAL
jgi:release factor glutamine methyltransferase